MEKTPFQAISPRHIRTHRPTHSLTGQAIIIAGN